MGSKQTAKGSKVTQAELARTWGVSRQMVHKWVKEGMPLESLAVAERWRAERLADQGKGSQAPQGLNDWRQRKVQLECENLELKIAVERAEYLPAVEMEEAFMSAGVIFSGGLATMVNDLPGMLAGLKETAIKGILEEQAARLIEDLKKKLSDDIDKTKRKARAAKIIGGSGEGTAKPAARTRAKVGRKPRKAAAQRKVKKV